MKFLIKIIGIKNNYQKYNISENNSKIKNDTQLIEKNHKNDISFNFMIKWFIY